MLKRTVFYVAGDDKVDEIEFFNAAFWFDLDGYYSYLYGEIYKALLSFSFYDLDANGLLDTVEITKAVKIDLSQFYWTFLVTDKNGNFSTHLTPV